MKTIDPAPNLLLVGAPKCGTTSLMVWLRKHPEVYHPWGRLHIDSAESGFLLGGIIGYPIEIRPRGTLVLPESPDMDYYKGESWILDKSPQHLYSEKALETVSSDMPNAKVIITLRDPYDLFISYHFMLLNKTVGYRSSLEELVSELDELDWNPGVEDSNSWAFSSNARFSEHVISWVDSLGEDRVRVVPLSSIAKNPRGVLNSISDWLGIEPEKMPSDLSVENTGGAFSNSRIRRFLREPPGWAFKLSHIFLPTRSLRKALLDPIRRMGWKHIPTKKNKVPEEIEEKIRSRLSEETHFFENLDSFIPSSVIIR